MKQFLKSIFLFVIVSSFFLPALSMEDTISGYEYKVQKNTKKYDDLIAVLEKKKEQEKRIIKSDENKSEFLKEEVLRSFRNKWNVNFEHKELPKLDGNWHVTKTTIKRMINPYLRKRFTFDPANKRLPFEKRDFENKEIVITPRGADFFSGIAIHPVTEDVYCDPNQNKEIVYGNYGFKIGIDPFDLSYSYTIKLKDHKDNQTLTRQVWLRGRLKYEYISSRKIVAKGWEEEYTPELDGFILDEVRFVLVRRDMPESPGEIEVLPFEQPAIAKEIPLESAKDKSGFEPGLFYKPIDNTKEPGKIIKVPGLW